MKQTFRKSFNKTKKQTFRKSFNKTKKQTFRKSFNKTKKQTFRKSFNKSLNKKKGKSWRQFVSTLPKLKLKTPSQITYNPSLNQLPSSIPSDTNQTPSTTYNTIPSNLNLNPQPSSITSSKEENKKSKQSIVMKKKKTEYNGFGSRVPRFKSVRMYGNNNLGPKFKFFSIKTPTIKQTKSTKSSDKLLGDKLLNEVVFIWIGPSEKLKPLIKFILRWQNIFLNKVTLFISDKASKFKSNFTKKEIKEISKLNIKHVLTIPNLPKYCIDFYNKWIQHISKNIKIAIGIKTVLSYIYTLTNPKTLYLDITTKPSFDDLSLTDIQIRSQYLENLNKFINKNKGKFSILFPYKLFSYTGLRLDFFSIYNYETRISDDLLIKFIELIELRNVFLSFSSDNPSVLGTEYHNELFLYGSEYIRIFSDLFFVYPNYDLETNHTIYKITPDKIINLTKMFFYQFFYESNPSMSRDYARSFYSLPEAFETLLENNLELYFLGLPLFIRGRDGINIYDFSRLYALIPSDIFEKPNLPFKRNEEYIVLNNFQKQLKTSDGENLSDSYEMLGKKHKRNNKLNFVSGEKIKILSFKEPDSVLYTIYKERKNYNITFNDDDLINIFPLHNISNNLEKRLRDMTSHSTKLNLCELDNLEKEDSEMGFIYSDCVSGGPFPFIKFSMNSYK